MEKWPRDGNKAAKGKSKGAKSPWLSDQQRPQLDSLPPNKWRSMESELDNIAEMFPSIPKTRLQSLYQAKGCKFNEIINYILGIKYIKPATQSETKITLINHSTTMSSTKTLLVSQIGQHPRSADTATRTNTSHAGTHGRVGGTSDDPEYCRSQASQLTMQRNQMYCKAFNAYRQRNNSGGNSGIASYYSQEVTWVY